MTHKRDAAKRPVAWIVVADRARARIFEAAWPVEGTLAEIETLVHPEGQARAQDLLTDGPGRFAELAAGPHSGEPRTDHRHRTANDFAGVVAERLEKGRTSNAFGYVVIVAPALFLGTLRNTLSKPLAKLVCSEINKDYSQLSARELLPLLRAELELATAR